MSEKKILVTGVSGLVGSGIANYFLSLGYCVRGTSRKSISNEVIGMGFESYFLDLDKLDQHDFNDLYKNH